MLLFLFGCVLLFKAFHHESTGQIKMLRSQSNTGCATSLTIVLFQRSELFRDEMLFGAFSSIFSQYILTSGPTKLGTSI